MFLSFLFQVFNSWFELTSDYDLVDNLYGVSSNSTLMSAHGIKKENQFQIILSSQLLKQTNSKSETGKNTNLSIKILIDSVIFKEGKKFKILNFEEVVNYNSLDNKFELKQYENILIKDLTQKILNEIHFFLLTN